MATKLDPPTFPTAVAALQFWAREAPDKLAFVVEGDAISYGRLWDDARRAAGRLVAAGLGSGHRCALVLPVGVDFLRLLFALQLLRAVPVAFNRDLPLALIAKRIRAFRMAMTVSGEADIEPLGEAGVEPVGVASLVNGAGIPASVDELPGPDDLAYVQITSGTTGEPKGAAVSHRNLVANIRAIVDRQQAFDDDVFVTWVPLHHDMGLVKFLFLPLCLGRPSYLLEPKIANFPRWLDLITEVGGTVTAAPDFGYRITCRMVEPARVDLHTLRIASNGGEPVRSSTIETFERRYGIPGAVRPSYGLDEATLTLNMAAPGEVLRIDAAGTVSCGRPLAGVEIRIVDEDGHDLPAGSQGAILARAEHVFVGYIDDPAATAEALSADGWLRTGDVGYVDDDGYLFVLGRKRAMIKHAGSAFPPREIEEAVDLVEGIRFSAVVGINDGARRGSESPVVVAEVRDANGDDPAALEALCRTVSRRVEDTIGFVPYDVFLVAPRTIHRTENGKIRHWRLQQAVATGELQAAGQILCRLSDGPAA